MLNRSALIVPAGLSEQASCINLNPVVERSFNRTSILINNNIFYYVTLTFRVSPLLPDLG